MDPLKGWSYHADPLPALDTYARHTLVAQYMYALVGPPGLRLMTPVVVYVELLAAPVALLGSYIGASKLVYTAVALICSLHVGIALTLRNSALLSLVACTAWCLFLPVGAVVVTEPSPRSRTGSTQRVVGMLVSALMIGSMVAGNLWLETISQACDQSVKHIWSTLLHNRWSVKRSCTVSEVSVAVTNPWSPYYSICTIQECLCWSGRVRDLGNRSWYATRRIGSGCLGPTKRSQLELARRRCAVHCDGPARKMALLSLPRRA